MGYMTINHIFECVVQHKFRCCSMGMILFELSCVENPCWLMMSSGVITTANVLGIITIHCGNTY